MKVRISPIVLAKLMTWQQMAGNLEIGVIGRIKESDGDILLLDCYFIKQESSLGKNSLDNNSYTDLLSTLFAEQRIQPGELRCHIHTHPSFSNHASNVDVNTAEDDFGQFDYMITGIWDKKDFQFHLNMNKPFKIRVGIESGIDYALAYGDQVASWTNVFKENFSEIKTGYVQTSLNLPQWTPPKSTIPSYVVPAVIEDQERILCTKYIKECYANLDNGKMLFIKSGVTLSDGWKPMPYSVRFFDKHGFTLDDLKEYVTLCVAPGGRLFNNSGSITERERERLLNADVRFKRLDLALDFFTDSEVWNFKEIAEQLGENDPWPIMDETYPQDSEDLAVSSTNPEQKKSLLSESVE